MSKNLSEIVRPFVIADQTVKTFLTNKREMEGHADPTYNYSPFTEMIRQEQQSWLALQMVLSNALIGQITHQRAGLMRSKTEVGDFYRYATQLEHFSAEAKRNATTFSSELKLLMTLFAQELPKFESAEETSMAYFISQLAIHYLSSLRPVNYVTLQPTNPENLAIHPETNPADLVLVRSSDWWRNYDQEGLLREGEWLQTRTSALADINKTNAFVMGREHELLRLGHFYAAVVALSNQVLAKK